MVVEPPELAFEILGPVRARRAGVELDLGPGKQRAVLAVLLLNPNRPTPRSKIVDAVWGDEPPENGANVVQKYIAGLRRVLEPDRSPRAPGQLITLTDAGYALHVPAGCLDANAFRDRVVRARAVAAAERRGDAAEQFRAALGLWREEALAGLSGPYFEAARERLAEERVSAFEESAQIELDLGRHVPLVPRLARLVDEFPLREQLRYLLMLALYRCDRQAEALAAYRETRRFLTEEFGVEPGVRLQRLHISILRSEPALAGESATVVALPPPRAAEPPRPARIWLRRALATVVPLASFGMFSWAAIAYFAARRRSKELAFAAVGYFVLIALFAFLNSDNVDSPAMNAAMLALLIAMAGGAAHAAVLVQGPEEHRAEPDRIRREQARTLVDRHPAIARELRIGRPDLSRAFNDGGLVDVNSVPEHVLAGLPGIGAAQARQIVVRRQARGGFTSVAELVAEGLLARSAARALSDRLVVIEPADAEWLAPGASLR